MDGKIIEVTKKILVVNFELEDAKILTTNIDGFRKGWQLTGHLDYTKFYELYNTLNKFIKECQVEVIK